MGMKIRLGCRQSWDCIEFEINMLLFRLSSSIIEFSILVASMKMKIVTSWHKLNIANKIVVWRFADVDLCSLTREKLFCHKNLL